MKCLPDTAAAIILLAGLSVACARLLAGCSRPALSPKDVATIANCQAEGRACKDDGGSRCYRTYDTCMLDGGMR